MNVQAALEILKKYGRVTITSDYYNPDLNQRQDYWCVMVTMYKNQKVVAATHSDLFWAANNVLLEVRDE